MIKRLRVLEAVFLGVAVLVAGFASGSASGWKPSFFSFWVILPYGVFYAISLACYAGSRAAAGTNRIRGPVVKSACVTAGLMLAFTLLCYSDTSSSSTACLVFVFAPLWLLIGGPVVFAVALLVTWLSSRTREVPEGPQCRKCGYSLIGLTEPRCPECGERFPPSDLVDASVPAVGRKD